MEKLSNLPKAPKQLEAKSEQDRPAPVSSLWPRVPPGPARLMGLNQCSVCLKYMLCGSPALWGVILAESRASPLGTSLSSGGKPTSQVPKLWPRSPQPRQALLPNFQSPPKQALCWPPQPSAASSGIKLWPPEEGCYPQGAQGRGFNTGHILYRIIL